MSNKTVKNNQAKEQEVQPAEVVKTSKKVKETKKTKKQVVAKKGGLGKKLKETGSELKKVNWPPFSKVVKHTGVVIAVVLIFTAILLGIDFLLSQLFGLIA